MAKLIFYLENFLKGSFNRDLFYLFYLSEKKNHDSLIRKRYIYEKSNSNPMVGYSIGKVWC